MSSFAQVFLSRKHVIYIVGGACRDLALGRRPNDWDFASSARPELLLEWFPEAKSVGKAFGTVIVPYHGQLLEVTTFRKESGIKNNRHPLHLEFSDSLEEDLKRRDFTINAMAIDPISMTLIDPFEGLRDLRNGFLQTVGNPHLRFKEDALRMLRAARFISQLGLIDVDPQCGRAAKKEKRALHVISSERIRNELQKLLSGTQVNLALKWLVDQGLWSIIAPGKPLDPCLVDLDQINVSLEARLAGLLLCMKQGSNAKFPAFLAFNKKSKLRSWALLRASEDTVLETLSHKSELKFLLSQLSEELIDAWMALQSARPRWQEHAEKWKEMWKDISLKKEAVWMRDLDINGTELLESCKGHIFPKDLSSLLSYLLRHVHHHPERNHKDALLKEIKRTIK